MKDIITLLNEYQRNGDITKLYTAHQALQEELTREEARLELRNDLVTDYEQAKVKPLSEKQQIQMRYAVTALAFRGKKILNAVYNGHKPDYIAKTFGTNAIYVKLFLRACGWCHRTGKNRSVWIHIDGRSIKTQQQQKKFEKYLHNSNIRNTFASVKP